MEQEQETPRGLHWDQRSETPRGLVWEQLVPHLVVDLLSVTLLMAGYSNTNSFDTHDPAYIKILLFFY